MTCLFHSIWDRVIGGSCVILVYLAVAILLSFKRKILGVSNAAQLQQLLNEVSATITFETSRVEIMIINRFQRRILAW